MQGDRYELALDAVARGRAQAGPHLIFDANEAVCRPSWASSTPPTACSPPRRGRRRDHSRSATSAICCAPAGPPRRRRSPRPWPARRRGHSVLALSVDRLAAARRSALAVAGRRRAPGRRLRSRRFRRSTRSPTRLRGLHRTTHQPLEQSVRGGTQTEGPSVRADRAGDPRAARRDRRGGGAPRRPAAAAAARPSDCSACRAGAECASPAPGRCG